MIVPNVIDITGPISGETSIAATMLDAKVVGGKKEENHIRVAIKFFMREM